MGKHGAKIERSPRWQHPTVNLHHFNKSKINLTTRRNPFKVKILSVQFLVT